MAKFDTSGLGAYIREQRTAAQISVRQLAKAADVSNPYLSQVERGLRKPSAEILARIAAGLRISAETLYVRAGILEERRGDHGVIAAISEDTTLTDRQRRALLEIYAAFQTENATSQEQVTSHTEEESLP
ncbi:MAG TPA: helix-turn-helix transcriptional regulator [Candidatus Nanopelagicales bacterium]